MNPFFMQMMNPIRMGFMGGLNFMMSPMCCCSSSIMNMPYYQDDNLWFFNQPVYRDTRYDYLLDPNLAWQRAKTNMQNGGMGIWGMTPLPGLSFPNIGQLPWQPTIPGLNQPTTPKTEAEKEAEKKKAEEAKKPAAKKAQKLNENFAAIKKLAENKANNFPEIPEELSKKAEEAMKKETADEQLAAMKEVMAAIPDSVIRKSVLADEEVRSMLRKAGYNFNNSKYSLKNSDIKDSDLDHADIATRLYENITAQDSNLNELMRISGQLENPDASKALILGFISTWNDVNTGKNKRLLRVIGANIPTGDRAIGLLKPVQEAVTKITNALLYKANEYKGYKKIDAAAENVRKALEVVNGKDGFGQTNMNKLSDAFDVLYARLRMQEAAAVRNHIVKNFSYLNEVKDGVIDENIVIKETQEDLDNEGISYPKVNDLDDIPLTDGIIEQTQEELRDLDSEYKDDPKGLLEALHTQGKLTPVTGKENLYQTKPVKDGDRVRYFGIVDDKIYEMFKKADDGEYIKIEDAKEVTAAEIGAYDMAVTRANKLVEDKALEPLKIQESRYPLFKATGANEYYIIKDNQLLQLKDVERVYLNEEGETKEVCIDFKDENRKKISINDLTEDDVKTFKDENIKTLDSKIKDEIKEVNSGIDAIEAIRFESLKDVESYTKRLEISKLITQKEDDETIVFEKVKDMNGYFKSNYNGQIRYYKYDENNNKLVCLTQYINNKDCGGVISIKDGIAKIQTSKGIETVEIRENLFREPLTENETPENKIQEYGLAFAKSVSGPDRWNDYPNALRKLNTLVSTINSKAISRDEKATFVLNFIKGYQSNCGWFTAQSKGICLQIIEETGINKGKNINETNSRIRYIAMIAKGVLDLAENIGYDNDEDKEYLEKVSKGNVENSYGTWTAAIADKVDGIIEKVFKYEEENN